MTLGALTAGGSDPPLGSLLKASGSEVRIPPSAQAKEEEARLEALLLKGLAAKRLPPDDAFMKGLATKTAAILDKYKDRQRP